MKRQLFVALACSLLATACGGGREEIPPLDLSRYQLIDLSHPLGPGTLYWPTSPSKFTLQPLENGINAAGYFYSAFTFCAPEHGGTHLDAPIHFSQTGQTADKLTLDQLIGRAVVIDIKDQTQADRDYRLTRDEVLAFETLNGSIEPGAIVLLRTGWSRFWPDAKQYLGDDTPGDASKLSFPSYSEEAARLLVDERKVAALGVDTASIDYGKSQDFMVHRIAAAQNVFGLENLTALDQLPVKGTTIFALPMKIEGGSGGPVRVVAVVPKP